MSKIKVLERQKTEKKMTHILRQCLRVS